MLRSMYSGISGLQNHQTKLDVIGNNIANVNTAGFKKGRFTFQDMISQQVQGATEPGADQGGTNPVQVGLGSQTGTIDTLHTQGAMQPTNRELDLAIGGDGYFRIQNPEGGEFYTRTGNFSRDEAGDLVNEDGYYVLGADGGTITIAEEASDFSIGSDGTVTEDIDGEVIEAGTIGLATFANPEGLEQAGGNLYGETVNSGDANNLEAGTGGAGEIAAGMLEMSNVDLSEEFVEMISGQRGLQANTRIITTSDEVLQEIMNLR
ncbi:flagellar basal body rod protein FlgG [Natribacillus halophilus]|uniref:Flagellar hook protein FlgE n=1 Tax=Natribacillus halophilus TaxID=549003 RepID=A0A1G8PN09_9BACI|nr:flagellar basal body rod protein FlgG [Natribacillus halophilus]SDI93969.1 flagellar hook protein FlgE [Natribacillus halophilus]